MRRTLPLAETSPTGSFQTPNKLWRAVQRFEITFERIIHHNLHGTLQRNQGGISTSRNNNNITGTSTKTHSSTQCKGLYNPKNGAGIGNVLNFFRTQHASLDDTLVENKLRNTGNIESRSDSCTFAGDPHYELLTNGTHGVGMWGR